MSRFDRKSHPALSRDHETHCWLVDDSYLRLHGLLNDDGLRLHRLLNDSNLGLHHGLLNNDGLGLGFDDSDVLIVEERSHHEVATVLASVDQMNALLNRTAGSEHSKGHVGVSDGLATEQVLVADLNAHSLVELAELLDRDLHMLVVPGGVLAAVDADV